MALLLSAPQCFFIAMLVFAVIGFMRGWRREVISMAFSLGGVLFLYLGGGNAVAQFIFVRFPVILQVLVGGQQSGSAPTSPPQNTVLLTTIITFVLIVALGYFVGNKAFPKPTAPADRLLGILPALVTGYFLIVYITNVFAKSPLITFGVNTPSQSLVGNYMLILFVVAVVVIVIALVAASTKKPSGGKK